MAATARSRRAPPKKPNGKKAAAAAVKSEKREAGGPDPLAALQAQLSRQLAQSVEETVSAVCCDFAREFRRSGAQPAAAVTAGAASTADYELYYSCCKRLVAYIAANMTTSPDFSAQMERIILACHSKASERVLRTVATKNVWFHRRNVGADVEPGDDDDEEEEEEAAGEDDDDEEEEEADVRRPTRATLSKSPKKSPVRPIKKERMSPARPTRSPAKKVAELPPPRAASKRRALASPEPPAAKRVQPARRRSLPLPTYDDEDEEEEEEEEEIVEEVGGDADADADDDDAQDGESNQPHYDGSDELLDFNDPVRDMCYVDKRTPAQTKFFKERLRKAILFVDAQLCKPPPGKVCGSDCKKIRAVMCDRNLPCRNKICRVWHDVEVHIDRCQNTHCELKNRVMLRETMHKIDHKKLQIQQAKAKAAAKKQQREDVKGEEDAADDREQFIELSLLTNEIDQIEGDIAVAEEELGILNGTKKAFWACLNVVGIELKDDVVDEFPDLATHYVGKKQPVAKPRAPKRAAKDLENFVPEQAARQRLGSEDASTGETSANGAALGNPMAPMTRRTTRRSTTKSFQAMAMDAVSVESDNESKSTEDKGSDGDAEVPKSATSSVDMADVIEESQENSVASEDGGDESVSADTAVEVSAPDTEKLPDSAEEGKSQELAMAQVLSELLPDTEAAPSESQVVVTKVTTVSSSVRATQSEFQVVVVSEARVEEVTTAVATAAVPASPQVSNIQILPSIGQ